MEIWHRIVDFLRVIVRRPVKKEREHEVVERKPRYVTLKDIYSKHYASKVDYDTFKRVVEVDPTFNPAHPDKMGKYGRWLLSLCVHGNLLPEDYDKARRYLDCFDSYRTRLRGVDLNRLKSLPDLYDLIKEYLEAPESIVKSEREIETEIKAKESIRLFEDEDWLIIKPLTQNAAVIYGRGTQWCTAAVSSENYFEYYNSRGPLHILISKKTGRKYQFHLASRTYCDETDRSIQEPIAETVGMSIEVAKFYQSIGWYDLFDVYRLDRQDNYFLKLGERYYLFSNGGRIVEGVEADVAQRLKWGGTTLYVVRRNHLYNMVWAKETQMMFDDWYEDMQYTRMGTILLNKQGNLRIYSLRVNLFMDEYIDRYGGDFGSVCDIFGRIDSTDYGIDLSGLDEQLFRLVDGWSDYNRYLKLFGKNARHYKQARYKVLIPTFQVYSLLGMVIGFLTVFLGNNLVSTSIGSCLLLLSLIIFIGLVFSSEFKKHLQTLVTFVLTNSVILYMFAEYGPKGFFCFVISFFVLLFILGRILKIVKKDLPDTQG